MGKQTVIIVHGMGSTTAEEFEKEFIDACEAAFKNYGKIKGEKASKSFDIKTFAYNEIFEGVRSQMTSGSSTIKEFISNNRSGKATKELPGLVDSVDRLYDFIGGDSKYATHWLDILIYRMTLFGEDVRIHFADFLVKVMRENVGSSSDIHVIGHSLGTSVVHDTLAKLYVDDFPFKTNTGVKAPGKLNLNGYRLGSIHLFANVSRVLESFINVEESIVKPGDHGCTQYFYQYVHQLDPIPRVKPFRPSRTAGWLSPKIWDEQYKLVETSSITAGNPHSLSHYLLDPENNYPLFKKIFPDALLNENDKKKAKKKFDELTLENRAKKFEQEFKDMNLSDKASVSDLLKAMDDLKDFLDGIGDEWRS